MELNNAPGVFDSSVFSSTYKLPVYVRLLARQDFNKGKVVYTLYFVFVNKLLTLYKPLFYDIQMIYIFRNLIWRVQIKAETDCPHAPP